MLKRLIGGLAGTVLMIAAASGQSYPPPTTPPEIPAPNMGVPTPGTSTTTIAPSPYGGYQVIRTQRGVDQYGRPITRNDIYRPGNSGGTERHETLTVDPRVGGNTYQAPAPHNPW
jgi:hypothetical protein